MYISGVMRCLVYRWRYRQSLVTTDGICPANKLVFFIWNDLFDTQKNQEYAI